MTTKIQTCPRCGGLLREIPDPETVTLACLCGYRVYDTAPDPVLQQSGKRNKGVWLQPTIGVASEISSKCYRDQHHRCAGRAGPRGPLGYEACPCECHHE
mgnify:CR=1 FL=1